MEFSYCWKRAVSHSVSPTDDRWGACPALLQSQQLHSLLRRNRAMILRWNQGSRSSETWHVSMVQHSLPAVLCFLTRVFGAMHGCLISSESFSFHPSAFHHFLSKVIYLPTSYWVMRIHYLLFSKGFEIKPPSLHKVHTPPASSRSSNLPEISVFMWDQHAGPNAFPLASERSEQQCIESLNILITQLC